MLMDPDWMNFNSSLFQSKLFPSAASWPANHPADQVKEEESLISCSVTWPLSEVLIKLTADTRESVHEVSLWWAVYFNVNFPVRHQRGRHMHSSACGSPSDQSCKHRHRSALCAMIPQETFQGLKHELCCDCSPSHAHFADSAALFQEISRCSQWLQEEMVTET